jgi:Cd2+/Zn2+-exporting ATPase
METDKRNRRIPLPQFPPDFLRFACLAAAALLLLTGLIAPLAQWLKLFMYIAAVLLAGYDITLDAVMKLIKEHDFDESLLMVIAVIGAFLIGRGFDGAAVMVLFRIGGYVKDRTIEYTTNSIESLLDQRPDTVSAIVGGGIVRKTAGKVRAGDIITLAPGERLSLDGVVVSGASELDVSAVTGNSDPVPVSRGSEVLSGSVNLMGVLTVRVTAEFDNSTISRMLKLIEKSESRKSKPEKMIARVARIFTPAVVGAALIIGVLIPLIGGMPFVPWLYRAFGFLTVAYPAALVISVPLTYFAGIGSALRKGILFKGNGVVDALSSTTSVVFEKTGTLTTGKFRVIDINSYDISNDRLLMLAAYAEARSNHPMARSIVAEAGIALDLSRIKEYREIRGKGTEVDIGGVTVSAGNALLMADLGITPDISQNEASVVYIAVNGKYAGRILLADALKQDSKKAVKELRDIGIDRIAIFTGEKEEVAANVAGQLGIQEYYAECLPDEKVRRLKGLTDMQLPGDMLVFVGDGLNDAPVLIAADVGVSIGGLGTDEAVEAADMVIMTDEPSKIPEAILLTRETSKIVRQNILLSFGLKGLVLLVVLFGVAMWFAVLADVCVTVLAILNALRAFGMRFGDIGKALENARQSASREDGGSGGQEEIKL